MDKEIKIITDAISEIIEDSNVISDIKNFVVSIIKLFDELIRLN